MKLYPELLRNRPHFAFPMAAAGERQRINCSHYDCNGKFVIRFPILHAAFFILPALLEAIRSNIWNEPNKMRDKYRYYTAE